MQSVIRSLRPNTVGGNAHVDSNSLSPETARAADAVNVVLTIPEAER